MNWLELVLKYFPVVLALVKEVQAQFPHASGSVKQTLVASVIVPAPEDLPTVKKLISVVVGASQAAGLLIKDSPVIGGIKPNATP